MTKEGIFGGLIEDMKVLKNNWIERAEQNETHDEMIFEGRIGQIQECIDLVSDHAKYSERKMTKPECRDCNGTGVVKDEMAGEGCIMDCHCVLPSTYATQEKQVWAFETEYQLEEFRKIERDHFDKNGNAYPHYVSVHLANMMLKLINQLESELPQKPEV